jgi:hypothetical protein
MVWQQPKSKKHGWDLWFSWWLLLSCCCRSLGFLCHVYLQVDADVSEKHAVSIFRDWSDKAGTYRAYVGPEEQGLREWSQSEGGNIGTGSRPRGSLQGDYKEGAGYGVKKSPLQGSPQGIANERFPWSTEGEAILPIDIIGMELLYKPSTSLPCQITLAAETHLAVRDFLWN